METVGMTIGIVGAGQMGSGIAGIAIEAGYNVLLYDEKPGLVGDVMKRYEQLWRRAAEKRDYCASVSEFERWTKEYVDSRLNRLMEARSLYDFHSVDLLIEAVVEDLDTKKRIFEKLDIIVPHRCILVTNTSSILIRDLAASVRLHQEKFMGMHFMNPPHALTLLEVVRGPQTSERTFQAVMRVAEKMGRTPVLESPDIPGFATNGTTLAFINAAALLVERMIKASMTFDDASVLVDNAFVGCVKTGPKPMGMLSLADLIGIDSCVYILREMAKSDPHYYPCQILENMLSAGRLGRKTGEGFFKYAD